MATLCTDNVSVHKCGCEQCVFEHLIICSIARNAFELLYQQMYFARSTTGITVGF